MPHKEEILVRRKIILTMVVAIIAIALGFTTRVEAQLQSRPGATALTTKTVSDLFIMARNMEAPNQTFGLNATIDQNNGTESTSNNIDVHMIKNTEWGAILMLGASAYGYIPAAVASQSGASTTGNNTGVYNMAVNGKWFNTASSVNGATNANMTKMTSAPQRYWNNYGSTEATYKTGDATIETKGWRNGGAGAWLSTSYPLLSRGNNGGMFSYNSTPYRRSHWWYR